MTMPYTAPSDEPNSDVTGSGGAADVVLSGGFSADDLPAMDSNITQPDDSVQVETGLMPGGSGGMKAANESRGTDDYPN